MTDKAIIPVSEYCRRCRWQITPARIKYWIRAGYRGETPPHRVVGNRYYLDAAEFDNWLDRVTVTRPEQAPPESAAALIERIISREDKAKED